MALVGGIDFGSFNTPSYVAWLEEGEFLLDEYRATPENPLPETPGGWPPVLLGIDAPQGLPSLESPLRYRQCDRDARTPTRYLPRDRAELGRWRLYGHFVRAAVDTFWAIHRQERCSVLGLVPAPGAECTVFETYPRYVLRQLWGGRSQALRIPSKRKQPMLYLEWAADLLRAAGYSWGSVTLRRVDQVDAMLCALAAEAFLLEDDTPGGTVGRAPWEDGAEQVLREGFIVAPRKSG